MVQATNFGNLHDLTPRWPLDWPHIRRILLERQVSSCPVVVHEVASQDAAQMAFVQDEDMIQTLTPDRADERPSRCGPSMASPQHAKGMPPRAA